MGRPPHGGAAIPALLFLLALPALGCGPVPPDDPFYLAGAKDDLARGYHWFQVGCHREALRFFDESLTGARLSDNVPLMVMGLNAKGAAFLAQRDGLQAASVLNEALELTLAEPGRPGLPALLGNMGTLAFQAGRPSDARGFWAEAASAATERGESPAPYLANLARLELDLGDRAAFGAALGKALAQLDAPGTPKAARSDILSMAALEAMRQGDPDGARALLDEATEIDRGLETLEGLAQDLEARHELDLLKGDGPAAAQAIARAVYLRASLKDTEGLRRDLGLLRESHKARGLPGDMGPFEAIGRDPGLFDPLGGRCP